MENQQIKSLTPIKCPCCDKDIIIELTANATQLTGIYTPEMLQEAKNDALGRIASLGFPDEFTKSTIDWINLPDTIFAPSDIEEIINNIQKPDEQEKS